MYLADTVFPAPLRVEEPISSLLRPQSRSVTDLSPLTMIVWLPPGSPGVPTMHRYASSAIANKCGSSSPFLRPAYAWTMEGE